MKTPSFRTLVITVIVAGMMCWTVGCRTKRNKVHFLDNPTPPGEIEAPASPPAGASVQPYRPIPEDYVASRSTTGVPPDVREAFREAYVRAKNPRVAVYVNRQLSDDVREWSSNVRAKVGYVETTTTAEGSSQTVGTAAASVERHDDGAGVPREDHWTWRIEDGLLQPLIESGARVVDRAMMLRLTALEHEPAPSSEAPVKKIETNALRNHADILVEVLISRRKDDKMGYVFRLEATRVEDGSIITRCSSATWEPRRRSAMRGEWQATDDGFGRRDLPNPETVAAWLAEDLMDRLSKAL